MRTLEENIAALEAANEDTRAVIREAHETIQSAKLVLAELRAERERWEVSIRDEVDAAVARQVSAGLESFRAQTADATKKAHQDVIKNFDRLQNIMLYGNEQGRGPSVVEDWVRRAVRDEIRHMSRNGGTR